MAKLISIAVTTVIWSAWIIWVTRTHLWEGPVLFSFDREHGRLVGIARGNSSHCRGVAAAPIPSQVAR